MERTPRRNPGRYGKPNPAASSDTKPGTLSLPLLYQNIHSKSRKKLHNITAHVIGLRKLSGLSLPLLICRPEGVGARGMEGGMDWGRNGARPPPGRHEQPRSCVAREKARGKGKGRKNVEGVTGRTGNVTCAEIVCNNGDFCYLGLRKV